MKGKEYIEVYLEGTEKALFKSPVFANVGDIITFNGNKYRVISREFEVREFTQDWADPRDESPYYITEYFSENYKLIVKLL